MVIFLYIIIAVVVGGAIILKWWYSSPKYKGKEGENRVHNILMQLPDDYVISSNHVVYDFNLLETILSFRTIYLSDNDVHRVVDILLHNNIREFVDDKSHVNNIYASKAKEKNKVALGICPKCGGNLVMRTGKYGTFYGCSNYPKCKFTTH